MTECAHTGGVSSEFGGMGSGVIRRCIDCGEVIRSESVQPPQSAPAQEAAPPARATRKHPAENPKAQNKPVDVVKLAKRRLKEVRRELKAMRKLEAELAQLERLLNAADGKPTAVVRELRASSR